MVRRLRVKCDVCGKVFVKNSNRAKCPRCRGISLFNEEDMVIIPRDKVCVFGVPVSTKGIKSRSKARNSGDGRSWITGPRGVRALNRFKEASRDTFPYHKRGPVAEVDPDIKASRPVDDSLFYHTYLGVPVPKPINLLPVKKDDVKDPWVPTWKYVPSDRIWKFPEDDEIVVPSKKKKLSEAPVNDTYVSDEPDSPGFPVDMIVCVECFGKVVAKSPRVRDGRWTAKDVDAAYPPRPKGKKLEEHDDKPDWELWETYDKMGNCIVKCRFIPKLSETPKKDNAKKHNASSKRSSYRHHRRYDEGPYLSLPELDCQGALRPTFGLDKVPIRRPLTREEELERWLKD